jgi:hypothetical protein
MLPSAEARADNRTTFASTPFLPSSSLSGSQALAVTDYIDCANAHPLISVQACRSITLYFSVTQLASDICGAGPSVRSRDSAGSRLPGPSPFRVSASIRPLFSINRH